MTDKELLARLVAFRSVSSSSNLDCIEFIRDWLTVRGIEARVLPGPDGKANLRAIVGPAVPGAGVTPVVPSTAPGLNATRGPGTIRGSRSRAVNAAARAIMPAHRNVRRPPRISPATLPSGTPSTKATVTPPKTTAMARPRSSGAASSAAAAEAMGPTRPVAGRTAGERRSTR
jgi:hypothetical protein